MSSTRYAPEGAPLRAQRWASNPAIECGLPATAIYRRCKVIASAEDRELVWAMHKLSWEIGLRQIAEDLRRDYRERIGTETMIKIGRENDRLYTADEVSHIRTDAFEDRWVRLFPVKGDSPSYCWADDFDSCEDARKEALLYPDSYPANVFVTKCEEKADACLARDLTEWCLNPEIELHGWPWYWADLSNTLRAYAHDLIARRQAGSVTTAVGAKIEELLDYTLQGAALQGRCLTVAIGDGRTGKSFAARQWCGARPGRARYLELPAGNDDRSFYQSLARGLGLGELTNLKANEIKIRVEQVLVSGDLLLCLDQCQRAWPQNNFRPGFPCRIDWIMSVSDKGVPICCIGTDQFNRSLVAVSERSGWDASQWNELAHYESIPKSLSPQDVAKVARVMLPGAGKKAIKVATTYALVSGLCLAAIESISRRARYLATRAGRAEPDEKDVCNAMAKSVVPSHRNAADALKKPATGKHSHQGNQRAQVSLGDSGDETEGAGTPQPGRGVLAATAPRSGGEIATTEFSGTIPAITGRNTRPIEEETEAEVIAG